MHTHIYLGDDPLVVGTSRNTKRNFLPGMLTFEQRDNQEKKTWRTDIVDPTNQHEHFENERISFSTNSTEEPASEQLSHSQGEGLVNGIPLEVLQNQEIVTDAYADILSVKGYRGEKATKIVEKRRKHSK